MELIRAMVSLAGLLPETRCSATLAADYMFDETSWLGWVIPVIRWLPWSQSRS
jgi:hypothetical protein